MTIESFKKKITKMCATTFTPEDIFTLLQQAYDFGLREGKRRGRTSLLNQTEK